MFHVYIAKRTLSITIEQFHEHTKSVVEPAPAPAACVKVTFKIFPTLLCASIYVALSTGNFVQPRLVKYCIENKEFLKEFYF